MREGSKGRKGRKGGGGGKEGKEEGIIYESMLMFGVYISPQKMSLRCQVQWPSSQMSDRPIEQEKD